MAGQPLGWTRTNNGRGIGPWHAEQTSGAQAHTWCVQRIKGIGRDRRPDQPGPGDGKVCQACMRALARG